MNGSCGDGGGGGGDSRGEGDGVEGEGGETNCVVVEGKRKLSEGKQVGRNKLCGGAREKEI